MVLCCCIFEQFLYTRFYAVWWILTVTYIHIHTSTCLTCLAGSRYYKNCSKLIVTNGNHIQCIKCCLQNYLAVSISKLDEMVELLRGELTTGARIKICALIIIDMHGIYTIYFAAFVIESHMFFYL